MFFDYEILLNWSQFTAVSGQNFFSADSEAFLQNRLHPQDRLLPAAAEGLQGFVKPAGGFFADHNGNPVFQIGRAHV